MLKSIFGVKDPDYYEFEGETDIHDSRVIIKSLDTIITVSLYMRYVESCIMFMCLLSLELNLSKAYGIILRYYFIDTCNLENVYLKFYFPQLMCSIDDGMEKKNSEWMCNHFVRQLVDVIELAAT